MHTNDKDMIEKTRNTARFFTEQRHISWVLLIAVVLWGFYGYMKMPKRKDPEIPVRIAVALTPWPGASAEKIEDLVTRKLESRIAENAKVKKIESISRTGLSVIYVELVEDRIHVGCPDEPLAVERVQPFGVGEQAVVGVRDLRVHHAQLLL